MVVAPAAATEHHHSLGAVKMNLKCEHSIINPFFDMRTYHLSQM